MHPYRTRSCTPRSRSAFFALALALTSAGALSGCDATSVGAGPEPDPPAEELSTRYFQKASYLLGHAGPYDFPSCAECDDGVPPHVSVNSAVPRDLHVYAAVLYAWEALAYHTHGASEDAAGSFRQMEEELRQADAYCPALLRARAGEVVSYTLEVWPCPAPTL